MTVLRPHSVVVSVAAFLLAWPGTSSADDPFAATVQPYVQKYCIRCHNGKEAKGDLNLAAYTSGKSVTTHFRRWNNITDFIRNGEMPPKNELQPQIEESNAVLESVNLILLEEARRNAGDPGIILPRRLSNTEYDLCVRDLTGVDIRPTSDFPADPAGGEGFNNTGEALRMSPNLVRKYLSAAQNVADYMVLKPGGIFFSPFPVTSYNERKKLTEQAIIDFYTNHEVDTFAYLEAAWRFQHCDEEETITIQQWAHDRGLSSRYLALVLQTLSEAETRGSFLKQLNDMWKAVPPPRSDTDRPPELQRLRDFVDFGRRNLGQPQQNLIRSNAGNWPISHLSFRAKTAAARDQFVADTLKNEILVNATRVRAGKKDAKTVSVFLRIQPAFGNANSFVLVRQPIFSQSSGLPKNESEKEKQGVLTLREVLEKFQPRLLMSLNFGKHPLGHEVDPESFVVKAPAVVEIPLPPEVQIALDGKNLLLPLQLDSENSSNGSAFASYSTNQPPPEHPGGNTQLLIHPGSEIASALASDGEVFCRTFPNRFFYVNNQRGLAAGFHLVEGYFRDDRPLVSKVLTDSENSELNRLWRELDFVTKSAETLIRGFVWFERSERHVLHDKMFDFLRSEDPRLIQYSSTDGQTTFPLLDRFEKAYLDKNGIKRIEDSLRSESPDAKYEMIHRFFEDIRRGLIRQDELMLSAEQNALQQLDEFAARAFRRPLRPGEQKSFRALYQKLRRDQQTVESSLRGVLTAVLMSPEFCFRYRQTPDGSGVYPLRDRELASRLSFFLWSSLPDAELNEIAEHNQLRSDQQLVSQTKRMLADSRVESFAREFFGQWLRYRDYLAKDPINAAAFPGYDDELRNVIAEEPVRLLTHLIQNDGAITELLTSDVTFLTERLAKHYGGKLEEDFRHQRQKAEEGQRGTAHGKNRVRILANGATTESVDSWYRVAGLREAGRGGLFGMAAVLTTNSAGERTSPVKRGFWTVHHLLGQHFPPPPADVPELPTSEKSATKTIRELLAAHVEDASCAICHRHFDGLGLAMEGFDPIGRSRNKDGAGRPIDNAAELPDGKTAAGIDGLIEYINQHRKQDFVRTLSRRFLGYALGRSVQLSDQPLLTKMERQLAANEYRFSALFESVVLSPQFRNQRGREYVTAGK